MPVKSKEESDKLILEIDNGDLSKLKDVMDKWSFKDYQSFMRFAVSIFLLSDDNSISIKADGIRQDFAPVSDLLKGK